MMSNAAADTVKIGLTVPLTGVQAGLGKEAEAVWRAFAKHANSTSLVRGHTLEVVVLDDGFDPARTKGNAELLAQQGVAVMAGTAGIPNVLAMVPVLEKYRIPLLGPASGSLALRGKSESVFHVKASFGTEVDKMARLLSTMGLRRVTLVLDDVADRRPLADRFAAELTRSSGGVSQVVATVVQAQKGGKVDATAASVLADKPDAIYVMTIPGLAGGVLKEIHSKGFRGFTAAWALTATDSVVKELGAAGAGIIFGAVMPSPTSDAPGIKASFQSFAKKQGITPSFRAMEIYVAGRILAEALVRRSDNSPVNGTKVSAALASLRDVSIDGWHVGYGPSDREASHFVDTVMLLNDGRFR